MPMRYTNKCHMNIMDYLSFGKIFKITNKQKKLLRKGVTPEEVQNVANKIFNKNTKMFVTILGNVEKKFIPSLEYLKEKFLISERTYEEKFR